ncbi:molybdate transport system substrate-binding protein [Micromonospora nigra]|uniref:Molybdate transport system substrate-binding protein n=1 Tax=Micromonospora nigra TaxID=145857 RepID=A0A1C6SZ41_9ACTN|nr:molybdate ABC transporter substrate-binding protein [Micromonospora nigra]SCL34780.1 molybdate transport system substrate-binding protein [Micromonospora nigra]
MAARVRRGVRGPVAVAVAVALTVALAACGGPDDRSGSGSGDPVVVFAAASLTESFTRIGRDFEAAHPGTAVVFTFAGSATLAAQINQGAPADVFASAAPANMAAVTDAGNAAGAPVTFARNRLVIAVPPGNPHRVGSLADLTRPGTKVAVCAAQVPCGAAARTALDTAGVALTPVSLEQDVKGALSKLTLGEVDAALVYRTDVNAADATVDAVEFAEATAAVNDCSLVVLADAPNPAGARAFVDHVRSPSAAAVLAEAGFGQP